MTQHIRISRANTIHPLLALNLAGLDLEFSYPAALEFLEKFKALCASIETFGYPTIEFAYQNNDSMEVEAAIAVIENKPISSLILISSQKHSVETRLIR